MLTVSTNQEPRVSIVVPNYNYARFLAKRLDTILNQTYQDFDVLFLDDASTDESRAVFDRYADDPRIAACFNEENSGGVFHQWNRGVELARGRYVWIAESDDYAEPEFLARAVAILDANDDVGIVYTQSWRVEGEEKTSNLDWTSCLNSERWLHDFIADGHEECSRYMIYRCTIPNASAVVFRRELYQKVGGAPEEFTLCGDWMTWVRMLQHTRVAYVSDHLNYFRQHAATTRARTCADLRDVPEKYAVMEYLNRNFSVESEVLEDARNEMANEVFRRVLPAADRGALQKIVALFSIALRVRRSDPRFLIRSLKAIREYRAALGGA